VPRLREDLVDHVPVHVRQPPVDPVVPERQLRVVDPHQVEDRRVQVVHVDAVLDGTVLPYDTPPYEAFLKEIASDHIPYRHAVRGTHLDFGDGVTGDVLNPPAIGTPYGTETDNATVNNYSTVIRLSYGKTHVMLDGDAEEQAEDNMLASADDVSADVLKCGHHGAANATSNTWLDRVRPRYAAISCGLHNSFGHPSPQTIDRLRAHGIVPTVTATAGAAVYVSDGVQVVEEKTP